MVQIEYSYLEQFRLFVNAYGVELEENQVIQYVTDNKVYIKTIDQQIVGCQIIDQIGNTDSYGEVE